MEKKIVYFTDELNEEFSGDDFKIRKIDDNYKYLHKHNPFKWFTHLFWYRIFINPIAHFYCAFVFKHKIKNKKCMKGVKGAYFLYGNHTHNMIDAFKPTMISGWKDTYLITNAANVSIPYIGRVTASMGAMPLPDTVKATKKFTEAIEYHIKKKRAIGIYPEAHIWPYSTWIRNFKDTSFRYPVIYDKPCFTMTTIYKYKNKKKTKVMAETYVDGPFYPDNTLSKAEARLKLRDECYHKMVERASLNDAVLVEYVKKEESKND